MPALWHEDKAHHAGAAGHTFLPALPKARQMTSMNCDICSWTPEDPHYLFIFETKFWRIVLARNQFLLGRCVLHLKRHVPNLSGLDENELLDWYNLVGQLEEALRLAFGPRLINWSCLLNNSYREYPPNPHVHWWAVPRYDRKVEIGGVAFEDLDFGSPYDHSRWIDVPNTSTRK